jgi:hypothetical protein
MGKALHIVFSDECYIYLDDNNGCVYVTQHPDEEQVQDCLKPIFKQSSVRVMFWGCIMHGVKGLLVVLEYPGGKEGGMDRNQYREQVLEGVLLEFYEDMKNKRWVVYF